MNVERKTQEISELQAPFFMEKLPLEKSVVTL